MNRKQIQWLAAVMLLVAFSLSAHAQEKIVLADAPEAVRTHVSDKYAKFKVMSVKLKKDKAEYAIELEKGKRTVSLVLAADGSVLSKITGRIYSYDGTEPPPTNGVPHNERE